MSRALGTGSSFWGVKEKKRIFKPSTPSFWLLVTCGQIKVTGGEASWKGNQDFASIGTRADRHQGTITVGKEL